MKHPSSRRIATLPVVLSLSAVLFMGAARVQDDPLMALPPGAMAVVTAGNPLALMANATAFARNAGIAGAVTALESFADTLSGKGASEGSAEMAAFFKLMDPARRIVLALYPGTDGTGNPDAVALVPVRNVKDAVAATGKLLAAQAGDLLVLATASVPGYMTIASGFQAAALSGTAYAASPASVALAAYPPSSLALWMDTALSAESLTPLLEDSLDSILPGMGADEPSHEDYYPYDEYAPTDNDDPYESSPSDGYGPADNKGDDYGNYGNYDDYDDYGYGDALDPWASLGTVLEGMEPWLEGIKAADLGLILTEDRAWLRGNLRVDPASEPGKMAVAAAAGSSGLPYLSWAEADALVAGAWSMPADWYLAFLEPLYRSMFPDDELAGLLVDSMREYGAAAGMNGALSLGLKLSPELVRAIRDDEQFEDAEKMELLRRGLKLDATCVAQLKDRQAFRDAVAASMELMKDPAYAAYTESSGFSMETRRSSGTADGMPWDRYTITATPVAGMAGMETVIAGMMFELLGGYEYWYKGDNAVYGIGMGNSAKALAVRGKALKPLSADKAFLASRAGMPADAKGVFWLSTRALAGLYLQFAPADGPAPAIDPARLGGLIGWISASREAGTGGAASLGMGFGIGAADIKAIASIGK